MLVIINEEITAWEPELDFGLKSELNFQFEHWVIQCKYY